MILHDVWTWLSIAFCLFCSFPGTLTSFNYQAKSDDPQNHALSDLDWRINVGDGYLFFDIVEPDDLQYTFKINPASFGSEWNYTHYGIGLVPAVPTCGCGSFDNAEQVEGNIAFIERGECSFVSKVIKAQEAGAIAAIITDQESDNDELYIIMQDDTTERDVEIPAAFLLGANGYHIRHHLYKSGLTEAKINVPVNISTIPMHKLKQPPWIVW